MTYPFEHPWIHGAPNCSDSSDPIIQVQRLDEKTFVLRINQCFSFEGNFIYLLIGYYRALLLDTGGPADLRIGRSILPIREVVDAILAVNGAEVELIVAHTHGDEDHIHWDWRFDNRPDTVVIGHSSESVAQAFGIARWPDSVGEYDLGSRKLSILPTPGHEAAHVVVYDHQTKSLFTGDILYPGILIIRSWLDYLDSVRRIRKFAEEVEIKGVFGAHIEMTKTPGIAYEYGASYQPDEHDLQLTSEHIHCLARACESMRHSPKRSVTPSFIIQPETIT